MPGRLSYDAFNGSLESRRHRQAAYTGPSMSPRTPPFDYARASALMDEQAIEALLVCSRANVGYLADYTYYTAQALPFLLEDGREWSLSFVGIPRDPALGAFITPVTGEEGIIRHADPWIEDDACGGRRGRMSGRRPRRQWHQPTSRRLLRRHCVIAAWGLDASLWSWLPYQRTASCACVNCCREAEFVDAAAILWALRSIKSAAEIQRLRHVAAVTDAAVSRGLRAARCDAVVRLTSSDVWLVR